MSGNTIGGIAGGLIGFAIGGPAGAQWGWMIGSVVGGIVDPQVIQGAQWQNQQLQGSSDGLARAVVFGTSTVTGNLLDAEPAGPRIGKKEEGGKGGPVVERDTAILTYAIEICDSSELRGTKINSVIAVWEDEKLVYDLRPDTDGNVDATRAASSYKWAANKKFYFGGEDQLPPPELEAIHGAGNIPAYRGSCIMTVLDEDLMVDVDDKPRGRIPTYRFLVSSCVTVEVLTPVKWDATTKTGGEADVIDDGFGFWGRSNTPGYVQGDRVVRTGNWYWETTTGWYLDSGSMINHFGAGGILVTLTGATGLALVQMGADGGVVFTNSLGIDKVLYSEWVPTAPDDPRVARVRHHVYWEQVVGGDVVWKVAIDNGPWTEVMRRGAVLVGGVVPYAMSRGTYLDPDVFEKVVTIFSMPDDFAYEVPAGARPLAAAGARTYVTDYYNIPDSPDYTADGDGTVSGPATPVGVMCARPLDDVVRTLHKIGAPQLSDAEFELSALAGEFVRGYTIQDAEVTVASACDPLRKVWDFDLPAYDGQIHAIKRGRAADWSLSEDDLVTMDSGYEESLQDESLAFPLKLHLSYTDPVIDYKETTQISERYSADARVAGEEKISMGQLVLTATEAKQAVVKAHKQAWANIEDTRKLAAPLEYIEAVNSDAFEFRNKRYRVDSMRVEGLQVVIESAAYDRISSYQSDAVGVEGTAGPDKLGAALRGPTVSVLMNMPVLRDEDDAAGMYWSAAGLLEGWKGARLQIARDGVTFTDTGVSATTSATMGTLVEAIGSASRYGMDEVNHIKVKLKPLSGGLESTDMTGLLREANAAALVYPDNTVEVIQFLTATETAEREYTLSGLLRGRMNTTPGAHAAGAWFVLLNDAVRFVSLRNDDSGTSPTFRAVSAGTVAETNLPSMVNIGVLQSLKEWEPTTVRAVTGAGEVAVTWAGRGRLGSSRMPVHSLNFKEYRATVDGAHTAVTTAQAVTVPAPGITEPYTTTVAALSRIASQFDSAEGT